MDESFVEDSSKDKIHYRKTAKRLFTLLKTRMPELAGLGVLLVAVTATKVAGPVIIRHAIDSDLALKNLHGLFLTLSAFLLNAVLFLGFNYQIITRLEKLALELLLELKTRLLTKLLNLHLGYFDKNPAGRLCARVQSDTDTLKELFTNTTVYLAMDLLLLAGTISVMAYFNWRLTLAITALLPFIGAITYILVKRSTTFFLAARKIAAEISGFLTEKLHGMSTLQVFGLQDKTSGKLLEISERKFSTQRKSQVMMTVLSLTISFMEPVAITIILAFGWKLHSSGAMTVGTIIMFIIYLDQLFGPIAHISEQIGLIQRSFAAGQRVFNILDTKEEITDPARPRHLRRMERSLDFSGVWLKYSDDAPYAVKDISFSVPRSSHCAIVGATGCGKSSLMSLLFKFYLPQKGDISIDGISIYDMEQASLRKLLGLVQQEIYLFPGTMLDNLRLMDSSVPESRVREAINAVGLDEFFTRHDMKKLISEKGSNLSVGEKQVISIVRAMVLDPEILVLDEATSSVDPHTDRLIQKATDRLFKGRTVIAIAHRLSTIKHSDQIIVLDQGRLREKGRHEELIERGGIYAKYFKLQFESEKPS